MLQRTYGTRIVQKAESRLMRAAGWALQALGILRRDRFMADFTTTLGRTIYLPYPLGSGDASPLVQLRTLAHEHQHVVQEMLDGHWYYLRYAFSQRWRARYEAEAYATGLELDRLVGLSVDPEAEAELVDGYGFDALAHEFFGTMLVEWWQRIKAGEHTVIGGLVVHWILRRIEDEIMKEMSHV